MMMMCSLSLCFKGSKDEKKVLFVFDRKKTFLISSLTKGLFHKTFFFVIHYKLAIKLQNFGKLRANLWSKFGSNSKSVIYGSVKFYGTGP